MADPMGMGSEKLPFKAPKLEVFGRARDITRNVGNGNAASDGGTANTSKTR